VWEQWVGGEGEAAPWAWLDCRWLWRE